MEDDSNNLLTINETDEDATVTDEADSIPRWYSEPRTQRIVLLQITLI